MSVTQVLRLTIGQMTLLSCVIHTFGAIVNVKYQSRSLCNAADRIANSCYTYVLVKSRIDCFNRCTLSDTCQGVLIVVEDNSCYHGIPCTFQPTCSTYDPNYIYFTSEENSTEEPPITTELPETTTISTEIPVTTTETTTKLPETTITTTELPETTTITTTEPPETTTTEPIATTTPAMTTIPVNVHSCEDMFSDNYPKGVYPTTVDLFGDGSVYFQTRCRLKTWMDTMLQFDVMMSSGMYDLSTLTWDDWVNGFHLGSEDYWIGLENLHKYTNTGNYRVHITVEYDSSSCSGYYTMGHDNFVVQSAANGYRYLIPSQYFHGDHLTGCGSPSQYMLDHDILLINQGSRFSTPDNDQDDTSFLHCAQLAGTGWWFSFCNPMYSNPLGRSFQVLSGSPTDQHVSLKGVNTGSATVRDAIKYVYMTLDIYT